MRKDAFSSDTAWLGEVRTAPGSISGWHHHGEHSTCGYVISGTVRVEFSPDRRETLAGGPGDFFLVRPHVLYREGKPGSLEQVLAAVRAGTGPAVEGPDSHLPAGANAVAGVEVDPGRIRSSSSLL